MVNLTELTAEKEINIGLFEKVVHRVVLQNPNLRYLKISLHKLIILDLGVVLELKIFEFLPYPKIVITANL